MLLSPFLKERKEEHVTSIAEGKRGFIDHFTLIVMEKLLQCKSKMKRQKQGSCSPDFPVVHHWAVGVDLAAFNPSGQMKWVQDTYFLYIHNFPTTAELGCV